MVRPKKTPASTLAISRKSSNASKSKHTKSNDVESDNENATTNNKRKLGKRLTSAGKLSTNQDEEVNDVSSVSENGNDLKNNSKKKQQQQQLKEEPSDSKDDTKSFDYESAVKDKQTRTKKFTNKSERTATPDEIASQTDKEPRKRRIASLNAEFLVHYCSSSNNNNNNNNNNHSNMNGTNLENKKLNNCPDTVSNASSLKQELNNKNNKNNKRQRILSVDSEKMKKEETSELEETNSNLKIKNNGTDKKSKKKCNNDELDESNTEKKNENFRKKNTTDNVDEEEEEELEEEEDLEEDKVAESKTTKRNPVHTRNSASRYNKGSDNVICNKTPNKKSIKFESDVEEEEHESNEEDEEKSNNLKKVTLKGRKAKRKLNKPLKKQPESESDHTDTESSVHSKKRRNTGAKRKAVDKSVVLESPQPTVRPKREAGMRASAMIIQTNEIEKTRFQYYSSNSTPAPNHSNVPGQPAPVLNVSASSKKKSNLANETNRKKAKNAEQQISKTDFQVPQSMSLFASLTAAAAVAATSKTSKTLAKSRSANLTASSPFTSSQMNQQIVTSTSRQISNNTHLNNLAADDSSSNDVLIVMETTSATKKASQSNKTPVERTLTEDLLAEHNKLNGTLGCGSGTFSNYTREFISKWALEYKCNDEKPFPPGFIPIESFGVKILNEPQYLQNKSRFGGSSSSSSTANQVPIAPVPAATMTAPKLNQRNTNMANNSSPSPAKITQPIIEIENKAVNEQVLLNHSTKPNNVQPPQVSQKTFSSNSNNRHSQSQPNLTSNYPASQIISSNINDILVNTASSISLNKAIASNPTFNNLAAALNLNLSLQQQQQQQQPQQQPKQNQSGLPLKKSFHSPLVAAVAVAQSLQSFQNSKKANNSTSLQAPMPTSVPAATTNSNFTFLNSFNATQLSQQIPSEWQFNQAFKTRDSLNASTSIENLLANGAIAGSKSYEIWNKIKSNHECNGNLSTSHEDSIKAISLIDEAAASFKNSSALFSSELSQAFSKLKNQQVKDQTQQQDGSVSAPNMTMINVENLNFYTSIEGEPPRFSNHELGCSGCLRNTNPCNQFNNNYHINQQVEIPATTPLDSHVNYPQTTAATVAMNIAKLLTNNSKNLVQTNNDNNSHSVFVSNFQNKTPIASSDKKQPQRLTKSVGYLPNSEIKKPSSNTPINESLKDENFPIKTENCKTKSFEKNEEKNKNGTQKDSCNQLSCSCRIKLEPECMTITIDTNNEHKNCCEAFQQMDLKLSPGKVNILKKKRNNQENCDSDSESVRSCSSSSSGSLVRLVVDEASSILEPSDSNLSKAKKIDTTEIRLAKTESIDKDNMSDSNFVTDVSKDNNSSSTRFFFSNKNSSEETALDKNTSEDSKNLAKKPKRWTFCQSESNDAETRDDILKDISNNIQISTNDFIVFNSDCLKNQSSKEAVASKPEAISGVYQDLINESSNTNYSAEEEDEDENKNESKTNSLCFGQVCSLWNDTESDMAMIKVKLFLRPEQLRNDLGTSDAEKEKVFEENELILSNFYLNEYEAENIRQKCLIFDRNSYENWKSEKLRKNDLTDDRSIATEKAEALNAFFYRYEYDFNKKSFVMN